MKRAYGKIFVSVIAVAAAGFMAVYAIDTISEGWRVNHGTTKNVTGADAVCKKVTNAHAANDYFVPTKTTTEWTAFQWNLPSGVSLASCAYTLNLTIASNVQNYNLRNAAIAAGWDGVTALGVTVTVNAGVYVGSASTSAYAFDTGTPFPAGSTLALINNGFIIGMGGQGGWGAGYHDVSGDAYHAATGGGAGGPALIAQYPITVTNNYVIGGGGGGGGGGSAYPGYARGGSGGGGGRGYNGGNGYIGAGNAYVGWAPSGGAGGAGGAGAGGAGLWNLQTCSDDGYGNLVCTPAWGGQAGGNGGDLWQAGGTGGYGGTWFGPAGGGAGGAAIVGNGNIAWAAYGTIAGAVY